jgi:hypothetical protein
MKGWETLLGSLEEMKGWETLLGSLERELKSLDPTE